MSTDLVSIPAEHPRHPALAFQSVALLTDTGKARMIVLAGELAQAVDAVEHHARRAVTNALLVGRLLSQANELVPHGSWEAWLKVNCRLAPRTCRAYMGFAKQYSRLGEADRQRVADLPLREAIKAITYAPEAPPRRSTSYQVESRADADRLVNSCEAAIKALREIKRWSVPGVKIKAAKVQSMRVRLQAALAMLDNQSEAVADAGGD